MKGFTDKSGKFRPTENKHGVRKSRDQSTKTQGVRMKRQTTTDKVTEVKNWDLQEVIKRTEKEYENSLKKYDFKNPNLRNKDWEVGITYEGGFGEEHFSLWASIKGSDKAVRHSTWISNYEWSEGMEEKILKRMENDDGFSEDQYNVWLAQSFDDYAGTNLFLELVDAIEEEYSQ